MDYLESICCLGAVARPMNLSMMSFVDREWVWPGKDSTHSKLEGIKRQSAKE